MLTEPEYAAALARLDVLIDALPDTPEDAELLALSDAIEEYEDVYYIIDPPTAEAAAEFRREQEEG